VVITNIKMTRQDITQTHKQTIKSMVYTESRFWHNFHQVRS